MIKAKGLKKSYLVGAILILVLIADLFIFRFVTDRPLNLAPSELSSAPKIHTSIDATPVIQTKIPSVEPYALVPAMHLEKTETGNSSELQVLGFAQVGKSLYVQLRLWQSMDLSLGKGWGKAIQLIDSSGRGYLYNSYTLPSAVELHDALVDLPNDLRARQTVVGNGYRDLYLCFSDFPNNAIPVQLRVIEAFQGNSPANPGFIYHDLPINSTGEHEERPAIIALSSLDIPLDTIEPTMITDNIMVSPKRFWLDKNLLPHITLEFIKPLEASVTIHDTILIDGQSGCNYNVLQLEETVAVNAGENNSTPIEILFERIPETVEIQKIWLQLSIDGSDYEITLEI